MVWQQSGFVRSPRGLDLGNPGIDTSSMRLFPEIIGFVRSRNIRYLPSGEPAGIDQSLTCVPYVLAHFWDFWSKSTKIHTLQHLTWWLSSLQLLWCQGGSRSCTGQQSLNSPPLLDHFPASSRLRSLASAMRSSQGTISSTKRSCLREAGVNAMSGLKCYNPLELDLPHLTVPIWCQWKYTTVATVCLPFIKGIVLWLRGTCW